EVLPWNPTSSGGSDGVKTLAVSATAVYAGGDFTQCGGKPRTAIASLNRTDGVANNWIPNAQFPNGTPTVNAIAVVGNVVFAGGDFTTIGNQSRLRLAALSATGFGTAIPTW